MIHRCRCLLVQRLVRTVVIVLVPEVIEGGLLAACIGVWRTGGVLLERPMEPFQAAILLRMRWGNALRRDAQPDPVDGQE